MLRHTIAATQITAVGHGESKIINRAPKTVMQKLCSRFGQQELLSKIGRLSRFPGNPVGLEPCRLEIDLGSSARSGLILITRFLAISANFQKIAFKSSL